MTITEHRWIFVGFHVTDLEVEAEIVGHCRYETPSFCSYFTLEIALKLSLCFALFHRISLQLPDTNCGKCVQGFA